MSSINQVISAIQNNQYSIVGGSELYIDDLDGQRRHINVEEVAMKALIQDRNASTEVEKLLKAIQKVLKHEKIVLSEDKKLSKDHVGRNNIIKTHIVTIDFFAKKEKELTGLLKDKPVEKKNFFSKLLDGIYYKFHSIMGFKEYRDKRRAQEEIKGSIQELKNELQGLDVESKVDLKKDLQVLEEYVHTPVRSFSKDLVASIRQHIMLMEGRLINIKSKKIETIEEISQQINDQIDELERINDSIKKERLETKEKELDDLMVRFQHLKSQLRKATFEDEGTMNVFKEQFIELRALREQLTAEVLDKLVPIPKEWQPYIHRNMTQEEAKSYAQDSLVLFETPKKDLLLFYMDKGTVKEIKLKDLVHHNRTLVRLLKEGREIREAKGGIPANWDDIQSKRG